MMGLALRLLATLVAVIFLLPLSVRCRHRCAKPASSHAAIDLIPSPVAWSNYRAIFRVVELLPLRRRTRSSSPRSPCRLRLSLLRWQVSRSRSCPGTGGCGCWFFRSLPDGATDRHLAAPLHPLQRGRADQQAGRVDGARAHGHLTALCPALHLGVLADSPRGLRGSETGWSGPYRMWLEIGLPLARPIAVSVGVLSFVHYWNSFVEPLLYIRTDRQNDRLARAARDLPARPHELAAAS